MVLVTREAIRIISYCWSEKRIKGVVSTPLRGENTLTVDEIAASIGYCGLVCKLCHLSDKCSGCKSEHNCCGRHLSGSGCYQYNCCVNKGIEGCWECEDFPCAEDMFSDSHDVRLRAFIRCAKEEGIEQLAEYVLVNSQKGIRYGHKKDYDGLGSEEAVLSLLRSNKSSLDTKEI